MSSNEDPPNKEPADARQRTIEELKEFERKKAEADRSLRLKLEALAASLPEDERHVLQQLLGITTVAPPEGEATVSVHLKPMQVHTGGGGEVSVFLKPMQVHTGGGGEVSVFLKPMQVHTGGGGEVSVFLKPMQVHTPESEVFLKPMQVHTPESEVFLKPMQVHTPESEVFLKPMQVHSPDEDTEPKKSK